MFSSAVERQFTIVGEALAALRRVEPETAASIPNLDLIVGFRNVLVHGYDEINKGIVWRTIEDDLPSLIEMFAAMLADDESL